MTEQLTGAALAGTIHKIVTRRPDLHDQGSWFHIYDQETDGSVDADKIQLVQILDEVEAEEMRKEEVSCNTTFCTAGWACILNGYTLKNDENGVESAYKDGEWFDIERTARNLLKISYDTAEVLFDGETSNDRAASMLADLKDGVEPDLDRCSCCYGDDEDDYDY